ncbi:hypothetical protein SCP_0207370 [Sparassis crispa]|uniref:Uncharacterized protein n=1 Tax=Sparassis crispa TaxID=139825 RepID=A0A401GBL3_9APHY|nr:hypothetical protein SCP_0207370 [Sparassis crispa]GBE79537.1 hypothetical protein SCP_0207370 [Sparassis crispa]
MQFPLSPEASLPTPPHSPRSLVPVQPATVLLDSLAAFYQQERYWIHHARAAIELAISKGADAKAITYPTPPSSDSSPSSSSSPAASPEAASDDPAVKAEPGADVDLSVVRANTRWMRRKNIMRLKLDGVSSHSHPHSRHRRPMRAPHDEPGARLLEMFSALVDARMESCVRVSTLVQRASRPGYHIC